MRAAPEEEEPGLPRMTEAEYLAFEETAELRHEFLDGEVRAMSGGTYEHALVGANLTALLGNRVKGGPCKVLSNDMRIVNRSRGSYFYPDSSVVCGEPEFPPHERRKITLQNPTALFEVVSPSTEGYERGDKLRSYLEIPAMRLYVIARADRPEIDFFERRDGELWSIGSREGVDASVRFESLGIDFLLGELYENVSFDKEDPSDPPPLPSPRVMSAVTTQEAEPAPLPRMTEEEYLAFEEASPGKHEFRDGEVVAMSGGTSSHSMVKSNLVTALGNRLRGGPCRRFDSDLRVCWRNRGQYFYPDASVVCGKPEYAEYEQKELTLLNPKALFEVVSPSTEGYDRGDKGDFCREIPSLVHQVYIDPDKPKVTFLRRGQEGLWFIDFREGVDSVLPLPALGIEIPFAALYENVEFEPAKDPAPRTVDPEA